MTGKPSRAYNPSISKDDIDFLKEAARPKGCVSAYDLAIALGFSCTNHARSKLYSLVKSGHLKHVSHGYYLIMREKK